LPTRRVGGTIGRMAPSDIDSSVGHSFSLEIDGVQIAGIAEVSGLALEQEVREIKETAADGTLIIRKLPGRPKAGEVTLIRALTADQSFENWVRTLRANPTTARKTGSLSVFNVAGTRLRRYRLVNAWPNSLEIGTTKAGDNSVLTEKLTLLCERLEPE
jgi:phage tail-like protein